MERSVPRRGGKRHRVEEVDFAQESEIRGSCPTECSPANLSAGMEHCDTCPRKRELTEYFSPNPERNFFDAWKTARHGRGVLSVGFYTIVAVLGVLSMGFQLLGSRLLSPHFGSSIIVWSWLISTFLAAFSVGSMLGGWISGLEAARRTRLQWITALLAVATLAFTATWGRPLLGLIEENITEMSAGLFVACAALFFPPVTLLSTFGPQCVHWLAGRGTRPGAASGVVYGVSTLGNIAGVMLTAFVLIPNLRVSTLLFVWCAVALVSLAALLALLRR